MSHHVATGDRLSPESIPTPAARTSQRRPLIALGSGTALVLVAAAWGHRLIDDGHAIHLGFAPLVATWYPSVTPKLLVAATAAGALVVWFVPAAERLSWNRLLTCSGVASLLWAAGLQATDGTGALWRPLTTRWEPLPIARTVGDAGAFLGTFVDRIPDLPTHVQGHPPGAVLMYTALDRLGIGDLGVAIVVLIVAASAAPATLIAFDRTAGRAMARRAAPFVGLAPAVIWIATSSDALYMGVAAWATALLAVAFTSTERRPRALAAAAGGGVLAGFVMTVSYAAPVLLAPAGGLALWSLGRRRILPVATAVATATALPVALAFGGFDWIDGFAAMRTEYLAGVAPDRPFTYFVVANLAALAIAIGPAAVAGLGSITLRPEWLLVIGALVGVFVADASGMSKGEVERIWLPFTPFLTLAAASLPDSTTSRRAWMGAQLAGALTIQALLSSPW